MSTKQIHARKIKATEEAKTPCAHPLCSDLATYWEPRKGQRPLPYCRAHHLEFKYLQHVVRQRQRPKPPSIRKVPLQPCGTPAAAARHRRRKEDVCDPCRIADNKRTAEYKAAIKAIRERIAA